MSDFNDVRAFDALEHAVDKADAMIQLLAKEIAHPLEGDAVPEPIGIILLAQDMGYELKRAFDEASKQWVAAQTSRQPAEPEKGGES